MVSDCAGVVPAIRSPGNQVTGFLAGFQPAPFAAAIAGAGRRPARWRTVKTSCRLTSPARSAASAGGTGTVKCERMLSRVVESPFWTGPLRSPNRLQNTFAHECMMDELAAAAKGGSGASIGCAISATRD